MPSIAVVMLVLAVAAAVATVVAVIPSSLFGRRALLSVSCSLNNFFDVGSPAVAAAGQHMVLAPKYDSGTTLCNLLGRLP